MPTGSPDGDKGTPGEGPTGRLRSTATPRSAASLTLTTAERADRGGQLRGTRGRVHAHQPGHRRSLDAGYLAWRDTFDGDQWLSGEYVVIKGPHPDANSDLANFCEVTSTALGL
jgi:hypothetical protein